MFLKVLGRRIYGSEMDLMAKTVAAGKVKLQVLVFCMIHVNQIYEIINFLLSNKLVHAYDLSFRFSSLLSRQRCLLDLNQRSQLMERWSSSKTMTAEKLLRRRHYHWTKRYNYPCYCSHVMSIRFSGIVS